jgi:hypothetical protein
MGSIAIIEIIILKSIDTHYVFCVCAHRVLAMSGKTKRKRKMLAAFILFYICRREHKSMHAD